VILWFGWNVRAMLAGILATEFGYLLVLVFVGPYGRHAIR
jgi:hypothetical protein